MNQWIRHLNHEENVNAIEKLQLLLFNISLFNIELIMKITLRLDHIFLLKT